MSTPRVHGLSGSTGVGVRQSAFTMIELLVVISIIALLAGLVVGGVSRAGRAGRESRIRAELVQLVTALESYKEAIGSYPPDNPLNPAQNSLFYELSGVMVDNARGLFRTKDRTEAIPSAKVKEYLGVDGIANATDDPSLVRRFVEFRARQYGEISVPPDDVEVLLAPVPWRANDAKPPPINRPGKTTMNPWRYLAPPNTTNNPGGIELWVEYVEGRDLVLMGNWTKDPVVIGKAR